MSKIVRNSSQFGRSDLPLPNDKILRVRTIKRRGQDYLHMKLWEPDRMRGYRPDESMPLILPLVMVDTFINLVRQVSSRRQRH